MAHNELSESAIQRLHQTAGKVYNEIGGWSVVGPLYTLDEVDEKIRLLIDYRNNLATAVGKPHMLKPQVSRAKGI